jgi:hypothetical protein
MGLYKNFKNKYHSNQNDYFSKISHLKNTFS